MERHRRVVELDPHTCAFRNQTTTRRRKTELAGDKDDDDAINDAAEEEVEEEEDCGGRYGHGSLAWLILGKVGRLPQLHAYVHIRGA